MQELELAESMLQTALSHASRVGAQRIAQLHLAIGQLSAIVVDLIQSHWDDISRGSPAEGAQLHFRQIVTRLRCLACDYLYAPRGGNLACPACHSTRFRVISGHEFRVEAIDIEPSEAFRTAFVDVENTGPIRVTEASLPVAPQIRAIAIYRTPQQRPFA